MMNSIFVIGNFGRKTEHLDGQTIKTRDVYAMLNKFYKGPISYFDTSYLGLNLSIYRLLLGVIKNDKIIIIPANGFLAKVFPILFCICKLFRKEIIHLGVGGWQVEFFEGQPGKFSKHPLQLYLSKRIKVFGVEIENVQKQLITKYQFTNTCVFPNFRTIKYKPTIANKNKGLKLVFLGRINKNKGCDSIIDLMNLAEIESKDITIDFYGPIEESFSTEFYSLIAHNEKINYLGELQPDLIYSTLENYDTLLLPTKYYTEGFPGSILDAYMSGIPVIVTEWKHAHEFVKEGETGFIVPFNDPMKSLQIKVLELFDNKDKLLYMKKMAYLESQKYTEERAWNVISKFVL